MNKKIERLEKLIKNFKGTHGYVDVSSSETDEGMLCIEITDGFNHAWFYSQYDCEDTKYAEILQNIIQELDEYSIGDELSLLFTVDSEGKPNNDSLFYIAQDVDNTITELMKYLETHAY